VLRSKSRDLFGTPLRQKRPRYESTLERADRNSLPDRAARARWLSTVIPRNTGFAMPIETYFVFDEAKSCYVQGNFVATVVLAVSFVEHWLSANLATRGFEKAAGRGLAATIEVARKEKLAHPTLLDAADRLREIRNPIVHLKSFDHEHGIGRRALKHLTDPIRLIEADARDASPLCTRWPCTLLKLVDGTTV
jgi:hypothetical protein